MVVGSNPTVLILEGLGDRGRSSSPCGHLGTRRVGRTAGQPMVLVHKALEGRISGASCIR